MKFDLPVLIAFFVYSYAKLRLLEFYYDFLVKVLDPADFQLIEMDTGKLFRLKLFVSKTTDLMIFVIKAALCSIMLLTTNL